MLNVKQPDFGCSKWSVRNPIHRKGFCVVQMMFYNWLSGEMIRFVITTLTSECFPISRSESPPSPSDSSRHLSPKLPRWKPVAAPWEMPQKGWQPTCLVFSISTNNFFMSILFFWKNVLECNIKHPVFEKSSVFVFFLRRNHGKVTNQTSKHPPPAIPQGRRTRPLPKKKTPDHPV